MRRAHKTWPASFVRIIPTLGRKPSGSITATTSQTHVAALYHKDREGSNEAQAAYRHNCINRCDLLGKPRILVLFFQLFQRVTACAWHYSTSTTPCLVVTAITPGVITCVSAASLTVLSIKRATMRSIRTIWLAP